MTYFQNFKIFGVPGALDWRLKEDFEMRNVSIVHPCIAIWICRHFAGYPYDVSRIHMEASKNHSCSLYFLKCRKVYSCLKMYFILQNMLIFLSDFYQHLSTSNRINRKRKKIKKSKSSSITKVKSASKKMRQLHCFQALKIFLVAKNLKA